MTPPTTAGPSPGSSPLLRTRPDDLNHGLLLFEDHPRLGCFDAVLAAAAMAAGAQALISADRAFGGIPGLTHLSPDSPELLQLLQGDAR